MATTPLNSSTEESSWKNTAYDLIKAAIDARDDVRIAQAVQVLNARIIDVQNTCIALQEELAAVKEKARRQEKELRQIKEIRADLENYAPYKTMRGGVCYRNQKPIGGNEDSIYICADCAEHGIKTYLQLYGPLGESLRCHKHGLIPSDGLDDPYDDY